MTPAEKETRLKALGFKGKIVINAEAAVRRLEQSLRTAGEASAYCLYISVTGSPVLMSKRTAEKFRDMFKSGDLDFLREDDGEVSTPFPKAGQTRQDERTAPEGYEWPEYTALDLTALFNVDGIPRLLLGLEVAKNQGNVRLPQFIDQLFKTKEQYPQMPPNWRAAVAGFPAIGEVIKAPAFASLAELIELTHPYLGGKLRRDYHKRGRPILRKIWEQVSRWSAPAGYELMPRTNIPVVKFDTLDQLANYQPSSADLRAQHSAVEDALEKGKTDLLRSQGAQQKVEETPEGLILDIVSRLPDVDRQPGKIFGKRLTMTAVLLTWCQIYPDAYEKTRESK